MYQLKYDKGFNKITRDINYIKNINDIPSKIREYITNTSNNRIIYEIKTKNHLCGKCLQKLDNNYYCDKCHVKHVISNKLDVINVNEVSIFNDDLNDIKVNYIFFDVTENGIYLYFIRETISYIMPYSYLNKTSKLDVFKVYFIEKDGITDVINNDYIAYKEAIECLNDTDNFNDVTDKMINFFETPYDAYLYVDNLKELKNTCYKYSFIWEAMDYLSKNDSYNLKMLTINPICYREFEYLIKMKLYQLAFTSVNYFKYEKNFEKIFGVSKTLYPFMIRNDISYYELCALRLYPHEDIDVIKFISSDLYTFECILKITSINLKKLKEYFDNNKLAYGYIYEYYDYLSYASFLGLNLKDNKVLFPLDLMLEHDKLYLQMTILKNPDIENKIFETAKLLSLNTYEDDDYIIYPADSVESLIEESEMQANCVKTYGEYIAKNICQIYFLRKKNDVNKSFVTIEVKDNKVVQARIKYNELPPEEVNKVIRKWEKGFKVIYKNSN